MENSESKKRKKSYYVKCSLNKKFKGVSHLKEGIRGFFITCNKYEKETVREAYNILNEYADKLYGSQIGKQVIIDCECHIKYPRFLVFTLK